MISLILSIASSVTILIIFKVIEKYNIPIILPIIINYIVATCLGFLNTSNNISSIQTIPKTWIISALIVGSIFVFTFYLIGFSTQKAGIAVTTIAAKMSFIFPMFFSIIIDKNDFFSITKLTLLILAILSVFFTVLKKRQKTISTTKILLTPLLIFIFLGTADSIIKYSQNQFITNTSDASFFTFLTFGVSAVIGLIILAFHKKRNQIINIKVLISGILLGLANFGSLYFFINALNSLRLNNSMVIAINNIGIVLLSVAIAYFTFNEHLSKINKVGIALSICTFIIILISL